MTFTNLFLLLEFQEVSRAVIVTDSKVVAIETVVIPLANANPKNCKTTRKKFSSVSKKQPKTQRKNLPENRQPFFFVILLYDSFKYLWKL